MTDKVLCPWCGSEMQLNQQLFISFYVCRKCGAHGPVSIEGAEIARAAALRRYEPPVRPLTLAEMVEHLKQKDAAPLWVDGTDDDANLGYTTAYIITRISRESYGRLWRCWPRKPTDAEREACGWEDDMSADT